MRKNTKLGLGITGAAGAAGVTAVVATVAVVALCCIGGALFLVFGPLRAVGCGIPEPTGVTVADVAGIYTTDGGRLELHGDGTFTSSGLDSPPAPGDDDARRPIPADGTWQLLEGEAARVEGGEVQLSGGTNLELGGDRKNLWLYEKPGDPDNCRLYRYDRAGPQPPPPTPQPS